MFYVVRVLYTRVFSCVYLLLFVMGVVFLVIFVFGGICRKIWGCFMTRICIEGVPHLGMISFVRDVVYGGYGLVCEGEGGFDCIGGTFSRWRENLASQVMDWRCFGHEYGWDEDTLGVWLSSTVVFHRRSVWSYLLYARFALEMRILSGEEYAALRRILTTSLAGEVLPSAIIYFPIQDTSLLGLEWSVALNEIHEVWLSAMRERGIPIITAYPPPLTSTYWTVALLEQVGHVIHNRPRNHSIAE